MYESIEIFHFNVEHKQTMTENKDKQRENRDNQREIMLFKQLERLRINLTQILKVEYQNTI